MSTCRGVPIECLTEKGLRWNGEEYPYDVIVFATGFDAITGTLLRMDVRGRGGVKLAEKWSEGWRAYLGFAMAGFPNLFVITGPGSPSFLAHVLGAIEQDTDWICECIRYLRDNGIDLIEPSREAEDNWVDHVNEICSASLFMQGKSWYLGENVPGKPRSFMAYVGGAHKFREICKAVADGGYEGFELSARS